MLSWTGWPDKAARDVGLARALADPRLQLGEDDEVIFGGRRLVSGGFAMILDTCADHGACRPPFAKLVSR